MPYEALFIIGPSMWVMGVLGLYLATPPAPTSFGPGWRRLLALMRFKIDQQVPAEVLPTVMQLIGMFWLTAGLAFWLIRDTDLAKARSVVSLVQLAIAFPMGILVGVTIRPK